MMRRDPRGRLWTYGWAVGLALAASSCATRPVPVPPPPDVAPQHPEYPRPDVPASLALAPAVQEQLDLAWRRFQAGDNAGAERDFQAVLRAAPEAYPAVTGVGMIALSRQLFRQADSRFEDVLSRAPDYLPAVWGHAEARVGLDDVPGAMAALERLLVLDPSREDARARVDLLKLRYVDSLIGAARRDRDRGRLDEAKDGLERALAMAPASPVILRDLARVDLARGDLDDAEAHARRAVALSAQDAEGQATLGEVLEARGRLREAAEAFRAAAAIEPRREWTERATALRDRSNATEVPAELADIRSAETVTRAQVAALIGMRLAPELDAAGRRVTNIATDVRGNWAESWILAVTQAGVMDVSPSHTFQPGLQVRRSDLANIVAQLLALVAAQRTTDLERWRAARPSFVDLPPANVYYPAAALAVASGAMKAVEGGRFGTTRPATGADVVDAVARVQQLAGRR